MKTDHPIYLFLSAGAEAFRVLTGGRRLIGPYQFCWLTLKGLERRLDVVFEPDGHAGPVYVIEFQGEQLDDWLEGIFDATSLEELIGTRPQPGDMTDHPATLADPHARSRWRVSPYSNRVAAMTRPALVAMKPTSQRKCRSWRPSISSPDYLLSSAPPSANGPINP